MASNNRVVAKSGGRVVHLSSSKAGAALCGNLMAAATKAAGPSDLKKAVCASCQRASS